MLTIVALRGAACKLDRGQQPATESYVTFYALVRSCRICEIYDQCTLCPTSCLILLLGQKLDVPNSRGAFGGVGVILYEAGKILTVAPHVDGCGHTMDQHWIGPVHIIESV